MNVCPLGTWSRALVVRGHNMRARVILVAVLRARVPFDLLEQFFPRAISVCDVPNTCMYAYFGMSHATVFFAQETCKSTANGRKYARGVRAMVAPQGARL